MSSQPTLFSYRQLGRGTGVLNWTTSVVTGAPVELQVDLALGTPLQVGTSVYVDTGANQEQVEVLDYDPTIPSFTANFNNNHGMYASIIVPSNYDPLAGQGQSNFLTNLAAVTQAINTRLLLFQGEWWASTSDGLPLWQSLAAQSGAAVNQMAAIITARIQGTPYVTAGGVSNVQAAFNSVTRVFTYTATVQTQFGTTPISFSPSAPSGALPA